MFHTLPYKNNFYYRFIIVYIKLMCITYFLIYSMIIPTLQKEYNNCIFYTLNSVGLTLIYF